jgi:hypothetical protein
MACVDPETTHPVATEAPHLAQLPMTIPNDDCPLVGTPIRSNSGELVLSLLTVLSLGVA